ncbi:hypothetical protein EBT11_06035, partial [bacterium]|nr:hypothetical protein [bacterium]
MDRLAKGISAIQPTRSGSLASAAAIMTSDTFAKEYAVEVKTAKGSFRVGGIAKGRGVFAGTELWDPKVGRSNFTRKHQNFI